MVTRPLSRSGSLSLSKKATASVSRLVAEHEELVYVLEGRRMPVLGLIKDCKELRRMDRISCLFESLTRRHVTRAFPDVSPTARDRP
jgi:hypothetical protein